MNEIDKKSLQAQAREYIKSVTSIHGKENRVPSEDIERAIEDTVRVSERIAKAREAASRANQQPA